MPLSHSMFLLERHLLRRKYIVALAFLADLQTSAWTYIANDYPQHLQTHCAGSAGVLVNHRSNHMSYSQIALYLLFVLQALDALSTIIALRKPSLTEANPLLAPLFKLFGVLPTMLVAKAVLAGYLFYVQAWVPVQVLLLLSAGYAYVVYNNFKLIRSN